MSDQPIDIHYVQLEEWLRGREDLITRKHAREYKQLLEVAPRMVQVAKYDVPALKKARQRHAALAEELRRRVDGGLSQVDKLHRQQVDMLESYGLLGVVRDALPTATAEEVVAAAKDNFDAILDVRLNAAFHTLCLQIQGAASKVVRQALITFDNVAGSDTIVYKELFPVLAKLVELAAVSFEAEGAIVWQPSMVVGSHDDTEAGGAGLISWGEDEGEPAIDFGDGDGGVEINWGDDGGEGEQAEGISKISTPSCGYDQVLIDAGVVIVTVPQLLHRIELRRALVDEADALLAFFGEIVEPTSKSDQPSRDALVPLTTVLAFKQLVAQLKAEFVDVLRSPLQQELLRYRSDLQSRNVFADSVLRLSTHANSIVSKREELVSQSNAAAAAALALTPQLEEAIKEAEGLQGRCESILCGVFAPRPVYLSGDINAL